MLLAIAPHLLDRLAAACPSARGNVFATADLAGVTEAGQITPALHLVLLDYTPAQVLAGKVRWVEEWCVIAVTHHAARVNRSAAQQEAAQALLAETLAALSGWQVRLAPGVNARLEAVPGPRPYFSESHGYFPLAFQAVFATPGAARPRGA
jgi:hypothetical protein